MKERKNERKRERNNLKVREGRTEQKDVRMKERKEKWERNERKSKDRNKWKDGQKEGIKIRKE